MLIGNFLQESLTVCGLLLHKPAIRTTISGHQKFAELARPEFWLPLEAWIFHNQQKPKIFCKNSEISKYGRFWDGLTWQRSYIFSSVFSVITFDHNLTIFNRNEIIWSFQDSVIALWKVPKTETGKGCSAKMTHVYFSWAKQLSEKLIQHFVVSFKSS